METLQQIMPDQDRTWNVIQYYANATNGLLSACLPALENVNGMRYILF